MSHAGLQAVSGINAVSALTQEQPAGTHTVASSFSAAGGRLGSSQSAGPSFARFSHAGERKFNLVIFRVNECTKGSPRNSRLLYDTSAITETLKFGDGNISEFSIRDCQRLGKFSDCKRRPILVTLTGSSNV